MKAVVVHAAGDLRVEQVPDPVPAHDEALIALEWGGICGSDLGYARHGGSGTARLRHPLVLGHEGAGRVLRAAADGSGPAAGTPVTFHPAQLVGEGGLSESHPELSGRSNLWPQVRYFGSAAFDPHEPGLFSALRAVRTDQLRPLPDGLDTRTAALAEPLAVALHAISRAGSAARGRILISGAGPIGLLATVALAAGRPGQLVVADINPAALEVATALGADLTVDLSAGQALPTEVDVALEASGSPVALGGVLAAVRRGGRVVQVGNLPADPAPSSLAQLVTREIELRGSYRFVDEIDDAIALLAGGLPVQPAIAGEFDIDDARDGFAAASDPRRPGKVLLRLGS